MAKEKWIHGKKDASHHVGRFSNEKRLQSTTDYTRAEFFYDVYGHLLSWCEGLAKFPGPLGDVHRFHLEYFDRLTRGIRFKE